MAESIIAGCNPVLGIVNICLQLVLHTIYDVSKYTMVVISRTLGALDCMKACRTNLSASDLQ